MAEYVADVLVDMGHYTGYNKSPVVPGYSEGNQMWILGNYLIEELHKLGRTTKATKMSRDDNPTVTQRGAMARGCRLAASLHSNAGGKGKATRAVGIHFVDDDCPLDDLSKEIALRLARTAERTMGLDQAAQVYARLSGRDRDGDGLENDDYYGFLFAAHQAGVPAAIIENGFHDHPYAPTWLLKDENLRKLAKAHAAEIDAILREHFDKEENTMSNTMRPGDRGENVRQLQGILKLAGYYDGELDGSYGPKTTGAVKEFQAANGLEEDGVAGPKTLEALRRVRPFADVPADAWYAGAVTEAAVLGLMEGIGGGLFAPERTVTRAELAAVAVRIAGLIK